MYSGTTFASPPATSRLRDLCLLSLRPLCSISGLRLELSASAPKSEQPPYFHIFPHSSTLLKKYAPLFSYTYKLLSPQILSFYILTNCRGCHPLCAARRAIFAFDPGSISFVSIFCELFARSFALFKSSSLLFSSTSALFGKNTRVGGTAVTIISTATFKFRPSAVDCALLSAFCLLPMLCCGRSLAPITP